MHALRTMNTLEDWKKDKEQVVERLEDSNINGYIIFLNCLRSWDTRITREVNFVTTLDLKKCVFVYLLRYAFIKKKSK